MGYLTYIVLLRVLITSTNDTRQQKKIIKFVSSLHFYISWLSFLVTNAHTTYSRSLFHPKHSHYRVGDQAEASAKIHNNGLHHYVRSLNVWKVK